MGILSGPSRLGVVDAPGGVDGEGVQVGGDLEAQAHGGGDHEAAADGGVIAVPGGVLVPVRAGLVDAGDGDPGGGAGVESVRIQRSLVRMITAVPGPGGLGTAGEAGGGDTPQVVAAVRGDGEDLVCPVGGAEELAAQYVYEVGAHRDGGAVKVVGELVGWPIAPAGRTRWHRGARSGPGTGCRGVGL